MLTPYRRRPVAVPSCALACNVGFGLSLCRSSAEIACAEIRGLTLLLGGLKRRGISYAGRTEKLSAIGVVGNEGNINNKIDRDGFAAAFVLQCLTAIGSNDLRLN